MITITGQYSKEALNQYLNEGMDQYNLAFRASGYAGLKPLTDNQSSAIFHGARWVFAESFNQRIRNGIEPSTFNDLQNKFGQSYNNLTAKELKTVKDRILFSRDGKFQDTIDKTARRILHSTSEQLATEKSRIYRKKIETEKRELASLQEPNAFPSLAESLGKAKKK